VPNQLFDTRSTFLTNQQKVFLIFLYRRLWGTGETEIKLSYSVVFEDFPCIKKNKQKFSDMISDLATKGLIKIIRGHKRCHTYIINEEHYKNLVYWGERSKVKDYSEIQNDIENCIKQNDNTDNDFSRFDINENTIETLIKVYQCEYKRLYSKRKCNITENDKISFGVLKNDIDQIPGIHYATFMRCYFLNDFDDYNKPNIETIFENAISNYNKYKNIVKQTLSESIYTARLFTYVYDSSLSLDNQPIEKYVKKTGLMRIIGAQMYYSILFCSKTFSKILEKWNYGNESHNEIAEQIKQYPVIIDYVNNVLKDDSIFVESEIDITKNETENNNNEHQQGKNVSAEIQTTETIKQEPKNQKIELTKKEIDDILLNI
jgi:hypothetical protein